MKSASLACLVASADALKIEKSDKDGMFAFGGENVTRGNLKNLIVDKPSPITVALAQKSDKDGMFAFGGENVTRGNLKNLIVDKPSPITVALAQRNSTANASANATAAFVEIDSEFGVDSNDIDFVQTVATEVWPTDWISKFSNVQLEGPFDNYETPLKSVGMVGNETLGDKVSCG